MGEQTVRQAARLAASGARAGQRRVREERDRRLERLAVEVITAVGERDAVIAATESRAGAALGQMVDVEGISLTEAAVWCAGAVGARDVARLRRLARASDDQPTAVRPPKDEVVGLAGSG